MYDLFDMASCRQSWNCSVEKATASYRAAIRLDAGHYNAWYGLGTVYYRQEKYELSEYHFRHALSINDRSSVLHCYLGMAQHALRRNAEALEAQAAKAGRGSSKPPGAAKTSHVGVSKTYE